jgi:hypothetical protein
MAGWLAGRKSREKRLCTKTTFQQTNKSARDGRCIVGFHLCQLWIPSCLCSAPEYTIFASQEDSGLSKVVAAESEPEKNSLLSLLALVFGTLKKPTQAWVGFLSVPLCHYSELQNWVAVIQ